MFYFLNTTAWWSWNSLPGHSVAVIHLSVAGPFVPRGPFQAAHRSWQVWALVCCEPIINPFSCHCNIPESLENQARKRPIQAHIARGLAPRTLGVLRCGIRWSGWRPARPLMMRWMHDVCHFLSPGRNQRILVAVVSCGNLSAVFCLEGLLTQSFH